MLSSQDKDTQQLIADAREEFESMYFLFNFVLRVCHYYFILSLSGFDFAHLPKVEVIREDLMQQYQIILLEHYSSDKIAVLPGDIIQKLMCGVRIIIDFSGRHYNQTFNNSSILFCYSSFDLIVGDPHGGTSTFVGEEGGHAEK